MDRKLVYLWTIPSDTVDQIIAFGSRSHRFILFGLGAEPEEKYLPLQSYIRGPSEHNMSVA